MSRTLYALVYLTAQSHCVRNGFTPGASKATNDALKEAIGDIHSQVQSKIIAGYKSTQDAVNKTVKTLDDATATADVEKVTSTKLDQEWWKCIRAEKNMLKQVEEAEQGLSESRSNEDAPCQEKEDAAPFSWSADPEDLEYFCNIPDNDDDHCDHEFQNYKKQIYSMLAGLEEEISDSADDYQEKKQKCDQAEQDTINKQSKVSSARDNWKKQKSSCKTLHTKRGVSMCLFGENFQSQCQAATAYSSLLEKIAETNGGEYSRPDRKKEWSTSVVTSCMLGKIVSGGKIDSNTLSECEKSVDYEGSVGKLDTMMDKKTELVEQLKVRCVSGGITFFGFTWIVPTTEEPTHTDYVYKKNHLETFSLTGDAFPFCA